MMLTRPLTKEEAETIASAMAATLAGRSVVEWARAFERAVDIDGLDTVRRALHAAEDEIHNPGCARANNYDVLDLIDQAKTIIKRIGDEAA